MTQGCAQGIKGWQRCPQIYGVGCHDETIHAVTIDNEIDRRNIVKIKQIATKKTLLWYEVMSSAETIRKKVIFASAAGLCMCIVWFVVVAAIH